LSHAKALHKPRTASSELNSAARPSRKQQDFHDEDNEKLDDEMDVDKKVTRGNDEDQDDAQSTDIEDEEDDQASQRVLNKSYPALQPDNLPKRMSKQGKDPQVRKGLAGREKEDTDVDMIRWATRYRPDDV
jgi:hypothetical protein